MDSKILDFLHISFPFPTFREPNHSERMLLPPSAVSLFRTLILMYRAPSSCTWHLSGSRTVGKNSDIIELGPFRLVDGQLTKLPAG